MSRVRSRRRLMQWKRYLRRCDHITEWRHRHPIGYFRHVYRTVRLRPHTRSHIQKEPLMKTITAEIQEPQRG